MANGSFSIKHTKKSTKFTYSGDLQAAIDKAENELKEKQSDMTKRSFLLWNYQRAKKELEAWDRRILDLREFIGAAKAELKRQEEAESKDGE